MSVVPAEVQLEHLDRFAGMFLPEPLDTQDNVRGAREMDLAVAAPVPVMGNIKVCPQSSLTEVSNAAPVVGAWLWNGAQRTAKDLEWEDGRKRADQCAILQLLVDVVVNTAGVLHGRGQVGCSILGMGLRHEGEVPAKPEGINQLFLVEIAAKSVFPWLWMNGDARQGDPRTVHVGTRD
jgi:hypothetical protein